MHINHLRVGTTAPTALRIGATPVERAYLGEVLVYGEQDEAPKHTVFGAVAPSYTMMALSDMTPSIECGAKFYLTDENGPVIGWRCTGGRVWIPNSSLVTSRPITLRAFVGWQDHEVELETTTPAAVKSTTTPAAGGWCEVEWDEPFTIDYEGEEGIHVVISYTFTDPSDQMKYIAATDAPSDRIASIDIGTTLVVAGTSENRGIYRIGSGGTNRSGMWCGADIAVEEAPAPSSTLPVAAYNFNEASGTVIGDVTGHGYALATQSQYFTPNGHAGSGLQQLAASDMAVDGSFTALDTSVQHEFTIMFWGKYENAGVAGDNWTISQTVFGAAEIGWGIMLSNGTDTVFGLRVQGINTRMTVAHQPTGQWHHYVLTGNRYYNRAYIDGALINEQSATAGIVGGSNDQNLQVFGGALQGEAIDDLRFFARALNPDAVQYYMNRNV